MGFLDKSFPYTLVRRCTGIQPPKRVFIQTNKTIFPFSALPSTQAGTNAGTVLFVASLAVATLVVSYGSTRDF